MEATTENPDYNGLKDCLGKTFITKHDSHYAITEQGEFRGRPSIEGAKVKKVVGVERAVYNLVRYCLGYSAGESQLDELITEYGQPVRPGLHLVASLTPEYVRKTNRYGIVTSPVKKIRKIKPA